MEITIKRNFGKINVIREEQGCVGQLIFDCMLQISI